MQLSHQTRLTNIKSAAPGQFLDTGTVLGHAYRMPQWQFVWQRLSTGSLPFANFCN